jgi:cell wall-associated NlpC family hydrolase
VADQQEPPVGAPAGGVGNGTATAFKVDDSSLKELHRTWTVLNNDLDLFNRKLVQMGDVGGKSFGKIIGAMKAVGMPVGAGASGMGSALSGGGFTTPAGSGSSTVSAAAITPSGGGGGGQSLSPAPITPSQPSRGVTAARIGLGIGAAAAFAPGAMLARNFGDITAMNFNANQVAQGSAGGYSMGTQNAAQTQLAGLGGYRNAQDLLQGYGTIAPYAGSYGTSRFNQVTTQTASFAALNPSAGLTGAAQSVGQFYAPQTQYAMASMGMGTAIGAGGTLQNPTAVARSVLTRIFGGKMPTRVELSQGMQPGAPLYNTLSRMFDPQTMQSIVQYGMANANLGGNSSLVNQALQQASTGHSTSLTKQAGLSTSIIANQNTLGRAQTGAQSQLGIDSAGYLNTAFRGLADAANEVTKVFHGMGGSAGVLAAGGMLGSGVGGKVMGLGGGFLGYNILSKAGGALSGRLAGASGGPIRNAVGRIFGGAGAKAAGGMLGSTGGMLAAEMSGATPVYVVNMPGGLGGMGGGGGLGGTVAKEGEEAEQAASKGGMLGRIAGSIGRFGMGGVGSFGSAFSGGLGAGGGTLAGIGTEGATSVAGAVGAGVIGGAVLAAPAIAGAGAILAIHGAMETTHAAQMAYSDSGAGVVGALLKQAQQWKLTTNPGWKAEYDKSVRPLVIKATSSRNPSDQDAAANALRVLNHKYLPMVQANQAKAAASASSNVMFYDQSGANPWGRNVSAAHSHVNSNWTAPSVGGGAGASGGAPAGTPAQQPGQANNQALQAIQWGEKEIGVPYVWGGETPGRAFDCSGLTQWAYRQAGVTLPRTAAQQQSATKQVDPTSALPGDLVTFGSPAHHVALYLGNGKMLAAPHTGERVQIQPVYQDGTQYHRVVGGGNAINPNQVDTSGNNNSAATATAVGGVSLSSGFSMSDSNPSQEEVDALNAALMGGSTGAGGVQLGSTGTGAAGAGVGAAATGNSGGYTGPVPAGYHVIKTGVNSGDLVSNVSNPGTDMNSYGNPRLGWPGKPGNPGAMRNNAALVQKMAGNWGSGIEWAALWQILNQESGFSTTAGNTGAAYGIFQADPGNKMASAGGDWASNPVTQTKWGLNYIKGRYGDPLGAYAHKRRVGWFDSGAMNVSQDQLAMVHAGEMIMPAATAAKVRAMAQQYATSGNPMDMSQLAGMMGAGAPGGSGMRPIQVSLTVPVQLMGHATHRDVDHLVHAVEQRLQSSEVIAAMGRGD